MPCRTHAAGRPRIDHRREGHRRNAAKDERPEGVGGSACDQSISRIEVEHEVDVPDGSRLRFHRTCLMVWQKDVAVPRREISGGSAPSPWTLLFDLHIARRAARDRAAYHELRAAIAETRLWAGATRARSRSMVTTCRAARIDRQRTFA